MDVYTLEQRWEILRHYSDRSTYRRCRFWQNSHLFRWSSFWSWRVCKRAKLSHLEHGKHARIHWKADAPKTSHCLVRILVQRHNWAIFLRKWVRRGRYIQWRSLLGHVLFLFTKIEEKDIDNIWFQQDGARCHTAEAIALHVLCPVFEDRIISRRADVAWPLQSCDLTPLDYYLWGAVKYKCYADKPETIDAVKDNIRKPIGEIQLHTIDNVLKNWTEHESYCMACRGSHSNEIIFHY